jgi:hypothetical protein
MKVKKLVKKLNKACIDGDKELEKELWLKSLKKSLKHKNTQSIK